MDRVIGYVLVMIVALGLAAVVATMASKAIETNFNKATAAFEHTR